jgi:dienelactone hydrolase
MTIRTLLLALGLMAGGLAHASEPALIASLNETVFKLPTTVVDADGDNVSGQMVVTQFKPPGDGPFPIAIIMHGRPPEELRGSFSLQRFVPVAAYLVRRGFAVWLPARLGYGDSGAYPDPENGGKCRFIRYAPVYEAAATSMLDVIAYAKRQPFADPARIIVIGQSYGGAAAIALAAKNPPGLLAAVNFAGGGGGGPVAHPYEPCRPDRLRDLFADYGTTARVPTLWVYAQNDHYWGDAYPKHWFATYVHSGGVGQFAAMPPSGEDGHHLIAQGFPVWRPVVDAFLAKAGFSIPKSADAPPATSFARLDEVDKVPVASDEGRAKYKRFLQLDVPRAYAIGPHGEFAYFSSPDAVAHTLAVCRKHVGAECKLYAVDDQVVWKE